MFSDTVSCDTLPHCSTVFAVAGSWERSSSTTEEGSLQHEVWARENVWGEGYRTTPDTKQIQILKGVGVHNVLTQGHSIFHSLHSKTSIHGLWIWPDLYNPKVLFTHAPPHTAYQDSLKQPRRSLLEAHSWAGLSPAGTTGQRHQWGRDIEDHPAATVLLSLNLSITAILSYILDVTF